MGWESAEETFSHSHVQMTSPNPMLLDIPAETKVTDGFRVLIFVKFTRLLSAVLVLATKNSRKSVDFQNRQQLRAEELEAIGKAGTWPPSHALPDREILTSLSQATEIIGGGAVAGNAEKHLPSLLSTGTALASLKGPSLRKVVKGTYWVTVGLWFKLICFLFVSYWSMMMMMMMMMMNNKNTRKKRTMNMKMTNWYEDEHH